MQVKFKAIDYLSIIYFSLIGLLISAFHYKVDYWYFYLIAYFSYICIIVLLAYLSTRLPENKVIKFLRLTYPIITFTFVYKSIQGYVLILHNHFLDHHITTLEKIIFGTNPTLALEKIVSKPLTEFLKFSYFSYYFYVPVPAIILFFKKRYNELEKFVFTITFTFYISYIGFVLYPIQGPRYTLAEAYNIKKLSGYIFTPLQDFIMANGAVRGACMPSSHLAVAWVSLFLIKKFFGKKPFWLIFPFTLAMTFSIVYNRYHYITDGVIGLIVGLICFQLCKYIYIENKK